MSGRALKFGAGVSLFPLAVLLSIELLDQATQSAFNVLTPNIRDAFHLTNAGILLIVAIAGAAASSVRSLSPSWPTVFPACPIALVGALVGAGFSSRWTGQRGRPRRSDARRHLHGAGRDLSNPQLAPG